MKPSTAASILHSIGIQPFQVEKILRGRTDVDEDMVANIVVAHMADRKEQKDG